MKLGPIGTGTYDIALAFVEGRLLHGLERVLDVLVSFARAEMHLRKVTVAEEPANDELLLQVEQDHEPFHAVDPVVAHRHRVHIEVDRAPPSHNNEAIQVLLRRVLEVVLFQPAVLDVEHAALLRISFALLQDKITDQKLSVKN